MYFHDVDDLDILYARMEREDAPPGLTPRVLGMVAHRSRQRRLHGAIMFAIGLMAAALLSFVVGFNLSASGILDVVGLQLQNLDLLGAAPLDFALGVAESTPWVPAILAGGGAVLAARALPMLMAPVLRVGARGNGR
ncbi:MAG: hypothetical protein QOF51_4299 [Chloroflexota bacterium]|jgi:hypothetical protein|nr:hypothetical protein [Chloroflexota bacterium]